jgi:hypothetical protein
MWLDVKLSKNIVKISAFEDLIYKTRAENMHQIWTLQSMKEVQNGAKWNSACKMMREISGPQS